MKKQLFVMLTIAATLASYAGERTIMAQRIKNLPKPWVIQPRTDYIYAGGEKEAVGKEILVNVNYDVDEEMNVWVKAYSLGENNRKAEIYVNDVSIGRFGDEKVGPGVKRDTTNWIKAPAKVALKNGDNAVKIVARSPYARIAAIYFTSDDNADPSKPRVLPELTGDEYTYECNLAKQENIGKWVKTGDRLDSKNYNDGMVKQPDSPHKKFDPTKYVPVVMEVEFDAPEEQNVEVWAYVTTSGQGWRTTSIYVNDLFAGTVGDGKIQPNTKAGGLQWEKGKNVVRVNKGKNILTIQANGPCSRIAGVVVTNDPEFEP